MRLVGIAISCILLQGCAYYFTQRPPIMERKMGAPLSESVGVMATAADYRVVYVQIKGDAPICAEPPPDAAGQFASAIAAAISGSPGGRPVGIEAESRLAVSMKQMFIRSQGVEVYRSGISMLCILRMNGWISDTFYEAEIMRIRTDAVALISQEIPYLGNTVLDKTGTPPLPDKQAKKTTATKK